MRDIDNEAGKIMFTAMTTFLRYKVEYQII